jgi:hypothetical protein
VVQRNEEVAEVAVDTAIERGEVARDALGVARVWSTATRSKSGCWR